MAAGIGPAHRSESATGNVGCGGNTQGAVHSGLATIFAGYCAASAPPCPLLGRGSKLPKVVEQAPYTVRVVARAPEKPEIAAGIGPARRNGATSRNVGCGGNTQGAVHSGFATIIAAHGSTASAHPCPFHGGRVELPEIVKRPPSGARIDAFPPKEPEMAAAIDPTGRSCPSTGSVCGGKCTQRAVHSGPATDGPTKDVPFVDLGADTPCRAASVPPCPFTGGLIKLPKVVEIAVCASETVIAFPPKEPEVSTAIGPAGRSCPATGNACGGKCTQRAVDSGLAFVSTGDRAAPAHPCPFACLGIRCRAHHR